MPRMIDTSLFGRNLDRILREKGMSQTRLAEELETTQQVISRYIIGNCFPSVKKLQIIANVLDVDVREFFRKDEDDYTDNEIVELYHGISDSMKKAVVEIMKVTQE